MVNRGEIEGRIDSFFYQPEFKVLVDKIKNAPYKVWKLSNILRQVINGYDSREYVQSGMMYLKVANVKANKIVLDNVNYIPEQKIEKDSIVYEGDLLLTRKGSYGIAAVVTSDANEAVISSEVFNLKIDNSLVSNNYLAYWFNSVACQKYFFRIKTGAIMGHISQEALKSVLIPIPPIEVQAKIVAKIDGAYVAKKEKEAEAQRLLEGIDGYLLRELGIELPAKEENNVQKRVFQRPFRELLGNRFDANFYKTSYKNVVDSIKNISHKNISHKKLGHIVKFSSESWDQKSIFESTFPYIEIGEIDISFGEVRSINQINIDNAPSRARMIVRGEDILVSTTRPNRGAIVKINPTNEIYIASTGFAVLREIVRTDVDRHYLYYVLRQSLSLTQMEQRSSGGNYPAITMEELANIVIPIPPIEQQKKVVADIYAMHTQAKQLRQEAEAELAQAKQAVEAMILGQ